jgi:hypothetical protein
MQRGLSIKKLINKQLGLTKKVLTFRKTGYSALNLVQAKSLICSGVPGSCRRNWLHGNANISKSDICGIFEVSFSYILRTTVECSRGNLFGSDILNSQQSKVCFPKVSLITAFFFLQGSLVIHFFQVQIERVRPLFRQA